MSLAPGDLEKVHLPALHPPRQQPHTGEGAEAQRTGRFRGGGRRAPPPQVPGPVSGPGEGGSGIHRLVSSVSSGRNQGETGGRGSSRQITNASLHASSTVKILVKNFVSGIILDSEKLQTCLSCLNPPPASSNVKARSALDGPSMLAPVTAERQQLPGQRPSLQDPPRPLGCLEDPRVPGGSEGADQVSGSVRVGSAALCW